MEARERGAHVDPDAFTGPQRFGRRGEAPPVLPVGDRIGAVAELARERDLGTGTAYGTQKLAGGSSHFPDLAHHRALPADGSFRTGHFKLAFAIRHMA